MTTGIEVDVADDTATVTFTDLSLRGEGVGKLLAAGGPTAVTKVTRPRVSYIVHVDVAVAAGFVDESPNYDDGKPDMDWSRKAINEYAAEKGIESPEKLSNKKEVLDAIAAVEAAPVVEDGATVTPTDVPPGVDVAPADVTDPPAGTPAQSD